MWVYKHFVGDGKLMKKRHSGGGKHFALWVGYFSGAGYIEYENNDISKFISIKQFWVKLIDEVNPVPY